MSSINDDITKTGIDPELKEVAIKMAGVESDYGANTKNEISSASGPFQILDGTWEAIVSKEYKDTKGKLRPGLNLEGRLGRPLDRNSVSDNLLAASALAEDHYKALEKSGLPKTEGNLYILHAFGMQNGLKLLRNPNSIAMDVLGDDAEDVAAGHPSFFKGSTTAAQVASKARSYYLKKANKPEAKAKFVAENQLG
jgi:hypothetical protein